MMQSAPAAPRAATPLPPQTAPPAANPATTIEQTVQRAIDEALRTSQEQTMSRTDRQNAIRQSIRDAINQSVNARGRDNTATVGFPQFGPDIIPPQAVEISKAFFGMLAVIIIGLPLARAFARRMDRRGVAPQVSSDLPPRLDRIEQAIEAVAIEVERISESQRYATKVMSELRGLPAPNPIESWPPSAKADAVAEPRRG